MDIPEWIAVISVVVAFLSLALQQHLTRRQAEAHALIQICQGNRELLSLGIQNPRLLSTIGTGDRQVDRERSYCQLWLNQVELMFRLQKPLRFSRARRDAVKRDMLGLMGLEVMRLHWAENREFYATDFQQFIERELYKGDGLPDSGSPSGSPEANL